VVHTNIHFVLMLRLAAMCALGGTTVTAQKHRWKLPTTFVQLVLNKCIYFQVFKNVQVYFLYHWNAVNHPENTIKIHFKL